MSESYLFNFLFFKQFWLWLGPYALPTIFAVPPISSKFSRCVVFFCFLQLLCFHFLTPPTSESRVKWTLKSLVLKNWRPSEVLWLSAGKFSTKIDCLLIKENYVLVMFWIYRGDVCLILEVSLTEGSRYLIKFQFQYMYSDICCQNVH